MACKILSLDLHGVVLRDKDLLNHIRENHNAYTAYKAPYSKNPAKTNQLVTTAYGQLAHGLHKVYGVDTSDFEERVYGDRRLLDRLGEILSSTDFQMEAKIIHELAMKPDWKVTLVSNTPHAWAKRVAEAVSHAVYVDCTKDTYTVPPHQLSVHVDDAVGDMKKNSVLFTKKKKAGVWYKQVSSIEELAMYIRSIDMQIDHNHKTTLR